MKRIAWLFFGILMVLALLMASCGPAETTTTPATTTKPTTTPTTSPTTVPTTVTTKPTTTTTATTTATATKSQPKYGGVFTVVVQDDVIRGFDPYRFGWASIKLLSSHCYEDLGAGDWAKGPGGTNEYAFNSYYQPMAVAKGALAESWEQSPDGLTVTIHIRKGILFHNKPPANGRELVAADVKYAWDRRCGTGSFAGKGVTPYNAVTGMDKVVEISTPDKYTVVFKTSVFDFTWIENLIVGRYTEIYPPEVITTYGNIDDWHNVCGTGAYMLTDYATASSLTFKKNPTYWDYDELNPKNKLPYADELRFLIIPDESTRVASMRAGKAEMLAYTFLNWRLVEPLKASNPDLQFGKFEPGTTTCLYMHQDVKPFNDVRVRQALQMALDRNAINKMVGATSPYVTFIPEGYGKDLYTPFEQLSKAAQDVLTYNPTKAKQLLAEAGYPNGFDMEIIGGTGSVEADSLSTVADYFGRIGVKVNIQLKETGVFDTMVKTRTYSQAACHSGGSVRVGMAFTNFLGAAKWMRITDTKPDEMWAKACTTVDAAARNKLLKDLNSYVIENVNYVGVVSQAPPYMVAQPWVKGWHGEAMLRYHDPGSVAVRLWIDRAK